MKKLHWKKRDIIIVIILFLALAFDVYLWAKDPLEKGTGYRSTLILASAIIVLVLNIAFLLTKKEWEGWEKGKKCGNVSWWGIVGALVYPILYFVCSRV